MTVRIHLKPGPRVKTTGGHCPQRRAARQMSTWLTQAAVFGYVMTVWKYGVDLGRVREFAFGESQFGGLMAHWQTWGLLSLAAQGAGVPLRQFSETPAVARRPLFVTVAPVSVAPVTVAPVSAAPVSVQRKPSTTRHPATMPIPIAAPTRRPNRTAAAFAS